MLDPGIGAMIEDVAFRAKDAADPGCSSSAVIATAGANLELTRGEVEAANGKDWQSERIRVRILWHCPWLAGNANLEPRPTQNCVTWRGSIY